MFELNFDPRLLNVILVVELTATKVNHTSNVVVVVAPPPAPAGEELVAFRILYVPLLHDVPDVNEMAPEQLSLDGACE